MTLPQLQGFRDALITAIAKGLLRVRFEDREIQYQSISEMKVALSVIDSEIEKTNATSTGNRPRSSYATFRND